MSTLHNMTFTLLGVTLAGLTACQPNLAAPEVADHGAELEVRLLATTDLHAYVLGYDYFRQAPTDDYGLTHTAELIHRAREEQPNNLLIDNGDLIQGSALGDWAADQGAATWQDQVHPVIRALNQLEFDVANLGNHEFNFGLDFMFATYAGAEFPVISANTFHAAEPAEAGQQTSSWQQPLVKPYVMLERQWIDTTGEPQDLNIGVIGFVPPQIMQWDEQHLAGKVRVRDMVAAARHYVPQMRAEGADLIIAVPHSGLRVYDDYPKFAEQASYQLAGVPGIDAILFGHQHRVFPGDSAYATLPEVDADQGTVRGIPAVSPGYWGDHLGVIDLTIRQQGGEWQVVDSAAEARSIDEATDRDLAATVTADHEATLTMLNEPIAEVEDPLHSYFSQVQSDRAVALINAAQTWFGNQLQEQGELPEDVPLLSAAAPFRDGSTNASDYTAIQPGALRVGDLTDLYLYPNTVQVVQVTGRQLQDWLERSALAFNQLDPEDPEPQWLLSSMPGFNFDVISGIEYRLDPTQPGRFTSDGELRDSGHERVTQLHFAGEPVAPDASFLVVTNNYRAGGGGSFPHLDGSLTVYAGQTQVREVLADYARAAVDTAGVLATPAATHWQLELPEAAVIRMRSGATELAREAAGNAGWKLVKVDGAGYGVYQHKGEGL